MNSPDPRGQTLWEMFLAWIRGHDHHADATISSDGSFQNPLEWEPGVPVPLDVSHGPEFTDALVRVESLRHTVRRVTGDSFDFTDYTLRVISKHQSESRVRVRCLPNGPDQWDKLLLRSHDEFAYAKEFTELLNDNTGVFTIEDDPGGQPVQFTRLHELHGPWQVSACEHTESPADPREPQSAFKKYDYWDYLRTTEAGEEFLFVEIDGQTGWTQLWRGSAFRL